MPILAVMLSLAIGAVLGLLGGGGAILMLPMLVYVVGLDAKTAIAMSLFVVGATSVAGTGMHARQGAVRWRTGGIFGATAMAGAFAGGRLAHFVPPAVLLVLFALVMVVTGIAMSRDLQMRASAKGELRVGRVLVLGAAVGALSGLVGAGGGFLIVPALVLFGGMSMRESIGTSLFVITLQSLAGFAGHVTHVNIDWPLMLEIAGAAAAGSVIGARASKVISPARLRHAFAWLVIAMGLFMFVKQLPSPMNDFTPIPALIGGALIGIASSLILLTHGKVAGISGIYGGLLRRGTSDRPFRLAFVAGLIVAG
ncbi:MAG: sulfite exporter TauE/SafE family protein, partial [Polyangiaceae bacterium]